MICRAATSTRAGEYFFTIRVLVTFYCRLQILFQVAVFAVFRWIVGIYGNLGLRNFLCPLACLEIDPGSHSQVRWPTTPCLSLAACIKVFPEKCVYECRRNKNYYNYYDYHLGYPSRSTKYQLRVGFFHLGFWQWSHSEFSKILRSCYEKSQDWTKIPKRSENTRKRWKW